MYQLGGGGGALFLAAFAYLAAAVPIDNGLNGDPAITCGPTSIAIAVETENTFEGHVFVKGRWGEEDCRQSFDGASNSASMELAFSDCGVRRERSANPKGVFVSVTVIISFHPLFITKIDRAIKLQCFYMEADKTVDTGLNVSMLTTEAFTQNVPMPVCRYEIRAEDANGEILAFAEVGAKVYHKWTCDTETLNTFCMLVHSCFVADGGERRTQLLDEDGCAQDKFVLGNLEYVSDLMAGRQVHVYKFPDQSDLFFDCQIRITVKNPDEPCEDTRPTCTEPVRGKRSTSQETCESGVCVDVSTSMQSVERLGQDSNLSYGVERQKLAEKRDQLFGLPWPSNFCLSWAHLGGLLGGLIICCLGLSTSILVALNRRSQRPIVYVLEGGEPPVPPRLPSLPPPPPPPPHAAPLPLRHSKAPLPLPPTRATYSQPF